MMGFDSKWGDAIAKGYSIGIEQSKAVAADVATEYKNNGVVVTPEQAALEVGSRIDTLLNEGQ